jgi:hypothetical protein
LAALVRTRIPVSTVGRGRELQCPRPIEWSGSVFPPVASAMGFDQQTIPALAIKVDVPPR